MRALCDYPWPGNVRELENTIEYALAIGLEDELGIADLPPEILTAQPQPSADDFRQVLQAYMNDTVPLAEIEKRYILSVLQQFGGNQVRAAAALGIDRSKLYRRLKQYGVMAVRFIQEEDLDGHQLRSSINPQPRWFSGWSLRRPPTAFSLPNFSPQRGTYNTKQIRFSSV